MSEAPSRISALSELEMREVSLRRVRSGIVDSDDAPNDPCALAKSSHHDPSFGRSITISEM